MPLTTINYNKYEFALLLGAKQLLTLTHDVVQLNVTDRF